MLLRELSIDVAADPDRRRHRGPGDRLRRAESRARRHLGLLPDPRGSGAGRRSRADQRRLRHGRADQPADDRPARRRGRRAGVSERHDHGAREPEQAVRVRHRGRAGRLQREHRSRDGHDPRSRRVDGARRRLGPLLLAPLEIVGVESLADGAATFRVEVQDAAAHPGQGRQRAAPPADEHVRRPRIRPFSGH